MARPPTSAAGLFSGRPATASARLLSGIREPVRLCALANVDISTGGLVTVDSVVPVAGDRILLPSQTDATENGIYTAAAGPWYRASDARSPRAITKGVQVRVQEGTTKALTTWEFRTTLPNIGDNAISVIEGTVDATLTALAALDATAGLVEQTGADAFTKRPIGVAAATDIPTRADGDARWQLSGATLASLEALSLVSGDILYATAADTLARLPKGTDGQFLRLASGIPDWETIAGGGDMLAANNLSDVASAATAFANIKQAASDTATGVVELSTAAEYRNDTANRVLTGEFVWDAVAEVTLTDAATIAVDMATFLNAKVTLGGNRTLGQPTNTKVGQSGVIRIIQDGTGTRTLAYHADWKFAGGNDPVATVTAGATDLLFYQVIAANVIFASMTKAIA